MQLTMRLKKRWITSVLHQANSNSVELPFKRGQRRNLSIARRSGIRSVRTSAHG
jgi:hypothetical protein